MTGDGALEVIYEGFRSNFQMVFARPPYGDGLLVTVPIEQRILRLLSDGTLTPFAEGFTPPFGPSALVYDADGTLLTTDQSGGALVRLDPLGHQEVLATLPADGSFGPTSVAVDPEARYGGAYVVSTFSAASMNPGTGGLYAVSGDGDAVTPLLSGIDGLELLTFGPGGDFGSDLYITTIGGEATGDGGVYTLAPEGTLVPFVTGIDATSVLFDTEEVLGGGVFIADLVEQQQIEVIWYGAGKVWRVKRKDSGVAVEEPAELPVQFTLLQNYPNPFNSTTTLAFELPQRTSLRLRLYDALGRERATLASGTYPAGRHEVTWDALGFHSGIYFYRLQAETFAATRTLILLR